MTKQEVLEKIEKILASDCTPSSKRFCYGYITALGDTDFLDHKEFMFLLNTIDLWKKGNTRTKMVKPDSMCQYLR